MAATTAPLVWDCYREVTGATGLGGLVHYYDEQSQSLYLDGVGLATSVAEVADGHWASVVPGTAVDVTTETLDILRWDHPSTGILYGIASDGASIIFLRYVYAMDVSPFMESWSWLTQNDNAIAQFSGTMQNLGPDVFTHDATLFQPGAKIIVSVRMGNTDPYPIGVGWIDECDFDISADTVDISGRNTVGYFLKDQTFDDNYTFTGVSSDIVAAIFTHAGITKYRVQTGTGTIPFTFEPSDSLMDGLKVISSAYASTTSEWRLVELPDGTVCVGYDNWIKNYLPNGYYSFDEGHDVFKRKTSKLSDSSYTSIRATGKGVGGVGLTPVTVAVTNFRNWSLGAHRTKHLKAPDGFTQAELQTWAEVQASKYQYVGIGEEFTGPFRPQLLVGDVAEVVSGEVGTSLGIITEVRQTFSRQSGFVTEFSVDSGGVVTDGDNYIVYSRAAEVNGFNRKQRMVDLVRLIMGK